MTRAELIRQVLENLRVVDAISAPAPEDASRVGRRLDQERARLTEVGLCWWEAEAIPDAVAGPFSDLVAERCANIFGKQYAAPNGQKEIAALKSSENRPPQTAEYF